MTPESERLWPREQLIEEARKAAEHAYAPYSRFRVGAVVVLAGADGERLVAGANVENASLGLTLCAERAALAAACSLASVDQRAEGHELRATPPSIRYLAVSCVDAAPDGPVEERMPCGACRQWIAELAPDATVFVDGVEGALHLEDLLPRPFGLRSSDAGVRGALE